MTEHLVVMNLHQPAHHQGQADVGAVYPPVGEETLAAWQDTVGWILRQALISMTAKAAVEEKCQGY